MIQEKKNIAAKRFNVCMIYVSELWIKMTSSNRRCINDPNVFCNICGEYTLTQNRRLINDNLKKLYFAYFGVHMGDQDKPWAPHIVCHTCREQFRQQSQWNRKGVPFAIPMVWREPLNHHDDCYFCLTNTKGFKQKYSIRRFVEWV